jgi:WD40-like Beta Propeller Repeat.
MRKRVNYVSLMFLFTLILGYNAQAQTIADRITKRDVQPKVERMPNIINTLLHDEYAPAISPDGRTLVYQSNAGGKTWEYYRLWQSMRDTVTGFWTKPSPIDEINGDFKQGDIYGGPSLSYDGKTLYFFAKMGEGSEDIYQSTKGADGKWGKPEKVAGAVNTGEYEGFPSISPDGMFLYFMRKKDGGSSSSNSGSAESDKGGSKTKYPSCYSSW